MNTQHNDNKASTAVRYRTAQVEGLEIFYREAGDPAKPTVLLLHGFPTSSFMFRELIPRLAADYHVVAPDYPGFGLSSAPPVGEWNYSFEHLYEVMNAFTQGLNLARYSLYMQDYGGPVGFRLASRHPERVQALVIQNANLYEEGLTEAGQPIKTYGQTGDPKIGEALAGMLTLEMTKFQFTHGAAHPERVSPDNWLVVQPLLDRPGNREIQLALFRNYSSNIAAYPAWHEYLRSSQPPVLVMWGQNDPLFSTRNVELFQRDVRHSEVHLLDGGHFALEEYPDEIAAAMRDFLAKNVFQPESHFPEKRQSSITLKGNNMKIALIGATGFTGSSILNEALNRGHQVTALVRHADKLPQHPNLVGQQADVFDTDKLASLLSGHDAVISAYNPGWTNPNIQREHEEGSRSILGAVKKAGVKRLLVVGGAGSLEVAPGVQVLDTPDFPAEYKDGALGTRQALNDLRSEQEVEWTFLSPSAMLQHGERTGKFRLGGDQLLVDADGQSAISVEDYAVALLDELENPQHIRQRFTVGY